MLQRTSSEPPVAVSIDGTVWADGLDGKTLTCLIGRSTPTRVADLAQMLVDDTNEPRNADRIQLHLHHEILPKLADAGLLAYDADEKVAEYVDSTNG